MLALWLNSFDFGLQDLKNDFVDATIYKGYSY